MNPDYNNLPLDFQHPGGFVEETMNYINETAVCPQPMFALAAALSLGGVLYGRRVQGADGIPTNLFVECVGYTSSGKDHGLKSIANILDECDASDLRLGQMTSGSAIEWALKNHPRKIALIDEAGYFFSGVSDQNAKGSPASSIKPALLELWSSANSRWIGKQRVPKDGKTAQDPIVVDRPHLCLYGTSQPQILFESVTRTDLRDGWLARNLWFISKTRPLPEFKPITKIPNSILAEVLAWKGNDGVHGAPALPMVGSDRRADRNVQYGVPALPMVGSDRRADRNDIITIPYSPEAQTVFAAFGQEVYKKMLLSDKTGDETNYLYGKAGENARRIALILAVSRVGDPLKTVVSEADARYATGLVEYLINDVIENVRESLSENADEKNKKCILKLLAKAGAEGLTRNELTRKTQFMRRKMRDEYIDDLVDGNQVKVVPFSEGHTHGEKLLLSEFVRQN